MGVKLNVSGQRYSKLIAISPTNEKTKSGGYKWLFKCDCGKEKIIPLNSVRSGLIKSCGCLHKPHGCTKTRLYYIWVDMRQRCENPKVRQYYLYGGKGITVCEEWQEFINFKKWAENNGYNAKLSIDRIDSDKSYTPDNCRWATSKEQARNTKRNHKITIDGVTKLLCDWVEISPMSKSSYYRRKRKGMSDKEALALDIPTKNPAELEQLVKEWGCK